MGNSDMVFYILKAGAKAAEKYVAKRKSGESDTELRKRVREELKKKGTKILHG